MGTKNNPGAFDCYDNAAPDEPMFILLGRDPFAPALVELWADLREEAGDDPAKVAEARQCAVSMRKELLTRGRCESDVKFICVDNDDSLAALKSGHRG